MAKLKLFKDKDKERREALENAEIVIKEWIEVAKERGMEVPEPKGKLMYA